MSIFLYLLISLVLGYFLWSFITNKWQEVYITQDVEEYMLVSGALQNSSIRFKSRTGGQEFNSSIKTVNDGLPSVSYSILVHEDKAHLAQELINTTVWK